MSHRLKCKDCGKPGYVPCDHLGSICDDCWDLRGHLMKALGSGAITKDQFTHVQGRMNNARWQGAATIREVLELPEVAGAASEPVDDSSEPDHLPF